MHVHVFNIYIYIYISIHACMHHTPAAQKLISLSVLASVAQSAAMSQIWLQEAALLLAMQDVHEVGDIVQHWQTGRRGTVTAVDGWHIHIKFDLFNPDGWKYNNDGWNERRRKDCFIVRTKRAASQVNADEEAAKRARLQ